MEVILRLSKPGHQQNWTKEEVLTGLNHFYKLYSRYPTAIEIDSFEYLPSSRSIQRQFGGLVALRRELIPNSHSNYTQGEHRSSVASEASRRAAKYEEEFYNFLCSHFDPVAVHEHKIMRPGNIASDYFVYFSPDKGLVLDLFYAKDLRSLGGVINIKNKRYASLPFKIIFVLVGNDDINIKTVRDLLARRKKSLPDNILVDTESNFKNSTIFQVKPLSDYSK